MIKIEVNGRTVEAQDGEMLLAAVRRAGIAVPTLCHYDGLPPSGACRMCVVEVQGQRGLVPSCAYPVAPGMKVQTHSARAVDARRTLVELLLANHPDDCLYCSRNTRCELQSLAQQLGIRRRRYFGGRTPARLDVASPSIVRDPGKCILCGKCVRVCEEIQTVGAIDFIGRGSRAHVGPAFDEGLNVSSCVNCGQCVAVCPTGALAEHSALDEVRAALADPDRFVVVQHAPSVSVSLAEEFGARPGADVDGALTAALRRLGFKRVFDTSFSADLTIFEEGAELISRLYKALVLKDNTAALPQFTSCSPGWIKFIETFYPEYLPNVSSAKSPQQMMGAVIKTYFAEKNGWDPAKIVSVSLMPCTAKKFEAARPEMDASGYRDVDYALTTREVARMIKQAGLDLPKLEESAFDDPFGVSSGSGVIFGATGGVMEAALRTVIELVTGLKVETLFDKADIKPVRGFDGVRIAEVTIPKVGPVPAILSHLVPDFEWLKGVTVKVGLAHGTANAIRVMRDIKEGGPMSACHFIEFMACPGGCLGGGGQPNPTTKEIRAARAKAIYNEDAHGAIRKSHENEDVLRIYREFFKEGPCSHKSHELLHTHYKERV